MLELLKTLTTFIDEAAEQKDFDEINENAFSKEIATAEKKLDLIIANRVCKSNQAEINTAIIELIAAYRYSYYKSGFKDGIKFVIEKAL